MTLGKRQRKFLRGLVFTLAALLVLLAALPLWFPWILRPAAKIWGARYSTYERRGYERFVLEQVTFTNRDGRFGAERIEATVPTVWLWRLAAPGRPKGWTPNEAFVRAEGWHYQSIPPHSPQSIPSGKPGSTSTYTNALNVRRTLETVARWVPSATLSNGTVTVEKVIIELPAATWTRDHVWAGVAFPKLGQRGIVNADWGPSKPYEFRIQSGSLNLESTVQLAADSSALRLQAGGLWWSNKVDLQAEFAHTGVLPSKAALQAPAFRFVPLPAWKVPGYSEMDGSLSGNWNSGQFHLDLNAHGMPSSGESNLPPFKLELHARGDTNAAVVESAVVTSDWLRAELSKEPTIHFRGQMLREPVKLGVAVDLNKQRFVPVQGALAGEAEFNPFRERFPRASFQFVGEGVGVEKIKSRTFRLNGNFDFPTLHVDSAECGFEDSSSALASGDVDVKAKTLSDVVLQFHGPLARQFLPSGYGYESLSVTGHFAGSLTQLVHQVHLEAAKVTCPNLQPIQLKADWSGRQLDLDRGEVELAAGTSDVVAEFAANLALKQTEGSPSPPARFVSGTSAVASLKLKRLSLARNKHEALALKGPAKLTFSHNTGSSNWLAGVDNFHCAGEAGDIQLEGEVDWPGRGHLRAALKNVSSDLFNDFLQRRPEQLQVHSFTGLAGWTNGPIFFAVELSAHETLPKMLPLSVELKIAGANDGVVLSNLVVSSQTSTVAVARGILPVRINPGSLTNALDFDLDKPLRFVAKTEPQAFFWNYLAQWTGVALENPNLDVDVSGTWQAPKGAILFNAQQVQFTNTQQRLPSVSNVAFELQLDREEARLTQCRLLVQNQPVTLTGVLPLGQSFWRNVRNKQPPDWQKASARLKIENAQVAAFAGLMPAFVAPQGEMNLDVSVTPGAKLAGQLDLSGARTTPLSSIGPIRDIDARLTFRERTLQLEKAKATIGGSTVTLAGQGDLRGQEWVHGQLPPFAFWVHGTNVPLSRELESIVRSDLDVAITRTNGAPPLISGSARLRDSYFLSDLADLLPGKVASPSRRPPYFSIEDPFLSNWRLAVKVTGERFLKVRSSLFNGQVSANLVVQGTLKEPVALGDVKIDSGMVRFPFANLDVKEGFVTLTSQNPYRPQLSVTAGSKQYGYDIKMDVSGPADEPVIQFTSTPPLSSEQILLMVSAGQLPKGEFTLTPQQRAQTVGLFLGRDLLSRVGVGDSAEQRLTVRSGEEMTEHGRPTYGVEYKLTGRWSLVGEYDRFGDYNAGVKWRVYSK